MKRVFPIFVFFLLLAGWLPAQQLNLEIVIERAARAVEEVLPQGTKVAILNFSSTSATFSEYVIDELTGKMVAGRRLTVVDRRNLALITQEMNLQLSGDVSDESAQTIGRMLGAQSIVSGTLTNMGNFYRFRIRVINVETAAIQTQVSLDLRNDAQVAFLLSGSASSTASGGTAAASSGTAAASGGTAAASGGTAAGTGTATVTGANEAVLPLTEGTMVPGNTLTEKFTWLDRNADSHNTYILVVNANENIAPYVFNYSGAINITIALRGDGQNRTIRLRTNGTMFTIKTHVTFVLENNITLMGHSGNNGVIVNVDGGTFKMRTGSTITGNVRTNGSGGGVYLGGGSSGGNFEMTGGTISNNTASGNGGGVFVSDYRTFNFSGGQITGNTASNGGGVHVDNRSPGGTLNMTGGIISGNTAINHRGGGVHVEGGTFTMRGGTITGNSAKEYGGGVYAGGTFTKTGGIITGYNTDQTNGNAVKDETGGTLARRGHAVFRTDNQRKETTAGTSLNLSSSDSGRWD
jgi:TolB-like protein